MRSVRDGTSRAVRPGWGAGVCRQWAEPAPPAWGHVTGQERLAGAGSWAGPIAFGRAVLAGAMESSSM